MKCTKQVKRHNFLTAPGKISQYSEKKSQGKSQWLCGWSSGGETHKPKTNSVEVGHDRAKADAVSGATPPGIDDPGAATTDSSTTITSSFPGTAISRCSIIVFMPNILTPLVHIPMHIVQTKCIRWKNSHICCLFSIFSFRSISISTVAIMVN